MTITCGIQPTGVVTMLLWQRMCDITIVACALVICACDLSPRACSTQALVISDKSLMPMLQLVLLVKNGDYGGITFSI